MYCTFHCTLSRFNFHVSLYLLLIARKQTMLIKRFNFVFIKVLPLVSQTNAQAVTAENEEQYTLSNIIYIKFQTCCLFSLSSILREVLLKCTQTN